MQYLGGKSRLGKEIAFVINKIRNPGQPYWEPFCGSCWVTIHVHNTGPMYASDGCFELIEMWKALQRGWQPPRVVTEEMYQAAKRGEYGPELTAFIGFGCSFGGKWFAGYARDHICKSRENGYGQETLSALQWKLGQLEPVRFFHADYRQVPPAYGCLIYADPPYEGTTGYHSVGEFDSAEFWQTCRDWSQVGNIVLVSEYDAPDDFVCVREMPTNTEIRTADNGREPRTERLFMHSSQAHLYAERVPVQLGLL